MTKIKPEIKAALTVVPIIVIAGLYVWTWFIPTTLGVKNGEAPLGLSLIILAVIVVLSLLAIGGFIFGVYWLSVKAYKKSLAVYTRNERQADPADPPVLKESRDAAF